MTVPADTGELSERERALLAALSAGGTDDEAATTLGVAARTVRRTFAELMDRLDARTRFQAGVLAVERGWPVVAPTTAPDTTELYPRIREFLVLLAEGRTVMDAGDRVGAGKKTSLRRLYPLSKQVFGARTHFQAGVAAAHHGLTDRDGKAGADD